MRLGACAIVLAIGAAHLDQLWMFILACVFAAVGLFTD